MADLPPRSATVERRTAETAIRLTLDLDAAAPTYANATGVGFLDHMLDLFARHGRFGLTVEAEGDLHVDDHHTVEDVGICLGQAFDETLGDKSGITRFGNAVVPMDEALARAIVDLSGRPYLVYEAELEEATVGTFPTELGAEFFRSLADHGRFNLHIDLLRDCGSEPRREGKLHSRSTSRRGSVRSLRQHRGSCG